MSNNSSSSSPGPDPTPLHFDAAGAIAHIAKLEQQLAAANAEGHRVVAAYNAERAKSQGQQQVNGTAANRTGLKVPLLPSFKGEVGFGVDNWLRRLVKHFEFYGPQVFPNDDSRISFATMFLEGSAMDWWDNISDSEKNKITSWELFVEALHSRFRPMQAAMVARSRLISLKQTGSVSAYANIFQKELTPIRDMSDADQIFFFRQGLKTIISQRVLEKLPKTLHEAMDIAVLADAHTSKSNLTQSYQSRSNNNWNNHSSSSAPRGTTSSSSSHMDMDISNIDNSNNNNEDVKPPVFHEDESSSISSASLSSDMMREFNRMKIELKKFQTQGAISALGSSSGSSSAAAASSRINVPKEEFEYCWNNRLCLKCKKPGHPARECRGKYQPLK